MIHVMNRFVCMCPAMPAIVAGVCLMLSVAAPGPAAPAAAEETGEPAGEDVETAGDGPVEHWVLLALQRLVDAYRQQGEAFAEAMLLAQCSGEAMRGQLAAVTNIDNWVGFDVGYWRRLEDEEVEQTLTGMARWLVTLESGEREDCWRQWRDWMDVAAQVDLLTQALQEYGIEDSMQHFSEDPLLGRCFDSVRVRRGPEFPDHLIGVTLASGEITGARINMVRLLLEAAPGERFACYSRLFALAAERQPERGESAEEEPAEEEPAEADDGQCQ